ncbi:MAG: signal peptide peptidase SppA [Coriobacteriia bacterium]|nr:signal peptide peptidase SppA [Coriobacteriia bacterium]
MIAGTGDAYSGTITPEYFYELIDDAESNANVKAILLRVDSPGGTVAASEEISEYVAACSKPVVVSIGDVGASGAYMVASQADEIWANKGSAVGSIGVIAQIPNVSGLMDKVGVEFEMITAGENKDTGSPYRKLTDAERALIQGEVDEAYDLFIDIVAEGRNMKRSEVEKLATGWAWSGMQAKEKGLIDELGTYQDALDAAAELGGIEGVYDVVTPNRNPLLDVFGSMFSLTRQFGGLDSLGTGTGVSRETLTRESLPR